MRKYCAAGALAQSGKIWSFSFGVGDMVARLLAAAVYIVGGTSDPMLAGHLWPALQRSPIGTNPGAATQVVVADVQSAEDPDVHLLLTCGSGRPPTIAIKHRHAFTYAVGQLSNLALRIDGHLEFSVGTGRLEHNLVRASFRATEGLFPIILGGREIVVSIPAIDGTRHTYTFSTSRDGVAAAGRCPSRSFRR